MYNYFNRAKRDISLKQIGRLWTSTIEHRSPRMMFYWQSVWFFSHDYKPCNISDVSTLIKYAALYLKKQQKKPIDHGDNVGTAFPIFLLSAYSAPVSIVMNTIYNMNIFDLYHSRF